MRVAEHARDELPIVLARERLALAESERPAAAEVGHARFGRFLAVNAGAQELHHRGLTSLGRDRHRFAALPFALLRLERNRHREEELDVRLLARVRAVRSHREEVAELARIELRQLVADVRDAHRWVLQRGDPAGQGLGAVRCGVHLPESCPRRARLPAGAAALTQCVAASYGNGISVDTTADKNAGGTGGGPRVVKRYANRKLYDTRDSRYVTLQQIAGYVRNGEDVQIIDNNTKEDLTNVTLAQIIYEEEKRGEPAPTSRKNLRTLIQTSGERLMHTLRDGPLGKLVPRRDEDDPEEPAEGDEGMVRSVVGPAKEALEQLQKTADDRVRSLVAVAVAHVRDLQAEVRRLQGRIEELEDRLRAATRRAGRKDSDPPSDNP